MYSIPSEMDPVSAAVRVIYVGLVTIALAACEPESPMVLGTIAAR
jgi:hypothetical protein